MKPLEQAVLKTLSYFDLFNLPLTQEELFKFLWMPPRMGFEEFKKMCEHTKEYESTNYECKSDYYFLPGREEIITLRQKGAEETERKLIKARRAVKFVRSVPFLRAIFVCNSVGARMAKPESDIDFFIIAEKNRIWIVRLFTNLILRLFGMRTYDSHQANRTCLSFYVDAAHLDLAPWRAVDDDIHFAYWLNQMIPLYDPENYYEKFLRANSWIEKYLPNTHLSSRAESRDLTNMPPDFSTSLRSGRNDNTNQVVGAHLGRAWKKMWEAMWRGSYGDMIEREAKKLQLTKMKLSLKEKAKLPDHGVVLGDGVIKLHENDTRAAVREKWFQKCRNI